MQDNQNPNPEKQTNGSVLTDNPNKPEQAQPAPQKLKTNAAPKNPVPLNIYPEPSDQVSQNPPLSASQMGLNQQEHKFFGFNIKKFITKGLITILLAGGVFAALVFANIVPLGKFKTISYDNNKGGRYTLKFYSKYSATEGKTGTKQLTSKVSENGKFPVELIITKANSSAYDKLKDCSSYRKVFDVQNDNLNQKISICDILNGNIRGQSAKDKVYVAGFAKDDQTHIITISQDYSDIDLSSKDAAQEALTKFGLDAYEKDIKTIISSINTE